MARQGAVAPVQLASSLKTAGVSPTWANQYATAANTSLWPYSANVVWQDTTSNATYCSASAALSQSKTDGARL